MRLQVRGSRSSAAKGGVGKTTCAAAAAVRAASEGTRVSIVSTDPAHSLADALGEGLGPEARRIRSAPGELYAAELDADRRARALASSARQGASHDRHERHVPR